ncbi:glycosyltransferase family 87 protein [Aquimarina algiphila]|uniref:glycosyltransferase family 87 protein n=1 Tax=Aquimarina algiphila TaxID=2047982 RepID=UPI00142FCC76|nr:glycosyltransferase family 87 protein [Aquimarina algiphila]
MKNIVETLKTIKFKSAIIVKVWIVIAIGIVLLKGVIAGWSNTASDFNNYYLSAKLVSEGTPIHQFYDNDWFTNKAYQIGIKEGAKFSPFPPITAYVYLPVTFFKPLIAKRVWLVFNALILIVLPFRIRKITKWSLSQTTLFLSLFIIPISSCLNFGQLYLLIGFLLLESLGQLYMLSKPKILGFFIGVLASLKYLPIIFLGYIIQHEKRYLILIFTFLGIIIPSLIIYMIDDQVHDIFFLDFISHLEGNLPGQGKYAVEFQSIDSLLNNLFVYDQFKNPFPLLNLSILKPIIKYSLLGVTMVLLFYTFKRNHYQVTPIIISIGIIGVFVMIPASASYHFLLLLWPILCIIEWLISFKSKKALVIISIMIFLTFTIQQYHIPNLDQLSTINLLLHYPRFWSLLCVFLLLNYYHIKILRKNYG